MRIFFAIDLPKEVKDQISELMTLLAKEDRTHAIKWTPPKNLHITLQFQAQIKSIDLPMLIEYAAEKLRLFPPYELKLNELELFPSITHPRFITLKAESEETETLSKKLGEVVNRAGYTIDPRPFRGHLTLGKIKGRFYSFPSSITLSFPDIFVHEIVLYQSQPGHEGSRYTVLKRITLKN